MEWRFCRAKLLIRDCWRGCFSCTKLLIDRKRIVPSIRRIPCLRAKNSSTLTSALLVRWFEPAKYLFHLSPTNLDSLSVAIILWRRSKYRRSFFFHRRLLCVRKRIRIFLSKRMTKSFSKSREYFIYLFARSLTRYAADVMRRVQSDLFGNLRLSYFGSWR